MGSRLSWNLVDDTALLLTDRPFRGMALATGLAVAEMWAGLALAYYAPRLPTSFAITAVATVVYAVVYAAALTARRLRQRHGSRTPARSATPQRKRVTAQS
jgi:hypothetical protein